MTSPTGRTDTTTVGVQHKPALTLGELVDFVDRCRAAGATDDQVIDGRLSLGGRLIGVTAQVVLTRKPATPPRGPSGVSPKRDGSR